MKPRHLLLVFCCSFLLLGGCAARREASGDVFAPTVGGSSGRTLECVSKAPDGSCNVKQCTASSEGVADLGVPYDCASYAANCVDAGQHWAGTKEGGKCTRVL